MATAYAIALVGGSPGERVALATDLRRVGVAVSIETSASKRDRMVNRLAKQVGRQNVMAIDDAMDRRWLGRLIDPSRATYFRVDTTAEELAAWNDRWND